ncbi:MAG: hypothetical protein ABFC92_04075 [Rectinema sp.]
MTELIETLRSASATVQAIAVSVGGLIGVFATLAFFFLMIVVADRFGKR